MTETRLPRHGRNHRATGSDPIPGLDMPWAAIGFAGYTSVPSQGSGFFTATTFGDGEFVTNDSDRYSLREYDPGADPNYFGLDVKGAGFYKAEFSAQMLDVAGHRVATPETVLALADNGGGNLSYEVNVLGSNFSYGYENVSIGQWDVSWSKVVYLEADPSTHPPIRIDVQQASGETIRVYTHLLIELLPGGA